MSAGYMTRLAVALRDPSLWGGLAAMVCGYSDIRPWAIVPLTLVLTMLNLHYGSRALWYLSLWQRRSSGLENIAVTLISSFCLVDLLYVAGDLLQHFIATPY